MVVLQPLSIFIFFHTWSTRHGGQGYWLEAPIPAEVDVELVISSGVSGVSSRNIVDVVEHVGFINGLV